MFRSDTALLMALVGWLVLALAGYSSYRLHWKKTVTMALAWLAIFVCLALVIALIQRSASVGEAVGLSLS
ncbi:MAG: hypothetical protein P0Y56_01550 [Candidatus Andeanibacterium colombiense]|uniref:Uncharacterized protein n=1 Tax=Candidatus Andeanibacterium colombiense TaxID=3121345 RepID=A0AAJ5XBQ6_9SPHN|nr:MAG: hypothetical protein P0Y56_01550 [Sphingomonadaceae bacterium]